MLVRLDLHVDIPRRATAHGVEMKLAPGPVAADGTSVVGAANKAHSEAEAGQELLDAAGLSACADAADWLHFPCACVFLGRTGVTDTEAG